MFLMYRYLFDSIGIGQIGLWALIISTTSVARLSELGLSAGMVKFIAEALGRKETKRASTIVQTVFITLAVAMGIICLLALNIIDLILPHLVPKSDISLALAIAPIAIGSLWMMVMTSSIGGALDGCLRSDLRCYLTAISQIVYLIVVFMLVPKFGLVGVAWAQLIQYGLLLIFMWIFLRRQLIELPIIPISWKWQSLRGVIKYGVSFQAITLINMLFDPFVKILLSRLGGLEDVGFYDIANNLVLKCRAIIIEAARVLVSTVASIHQDHQLKIRMIFLNSYEINFYISVIIFGTLAICLEMMSILLLGGYQPTFITFALLLNLGWFSNTIIGPSYFSNLGSGSLRTNIYSHIISSATVAVLGPILAILFGGLGVVIGVASGLIFGAFYLLITHFKALSINWKVDSIPAGGISLLFLAIGQTFAVYFLINQKSSVFDVVLITFIFSLFIPTLCFVNLNVRNILKKYLYKFIKL
jgi:O-antigen/teichoic acid export membrane protein